MAWQVKFRGAVLRRLALTLVLATAYLPSGERAWAVCNTSPCNQGPTIADWLQAHYDHFGNAPNGIPQSDIPPPSDPARFNEGTDPGLGDIVDPFLNPWGHLGMYVAPVGSNNYVGGAAAGFGSVMTSSGYGLTDTAGAVPANTRSSGFKAVGGGGAIAGVFDASRYVGLSGDQSLTVQGYFKYDADSISIGSSTLAVPLIGGNAGSIHSDTYRFGGTALYQFGASYVSGWGEYDFGHSHETNALTASLGAFDDHGYAVDGRIGHIFILANSIPPSSGSALTKTPVAAGGTLFALDLSAHVGYSDDRTDTFTDTTGFIFGTAESASGDYGARARVTAYSPVDGVLWMPYVSATFDHLFDVKNTAFDPAQAALPTGDILSFDVDKTFVGGDFGIEARGRGGWVIGGKGFIDGSADTTIIGGMGYVKIPFNYTPVVAARY
jgi:hypothetical protein